MCHGTRPLTYPPINIGESRLVAMMLEACPESSPKLGERPSTYLSEINHTSVPKGSIRGNFLRTVSNRILEFVDDAPTRNFLRQTQGSTLATEARAYLKYVLCRTMGHVGDGSAGCYSRKCAWRVTSTSVATTPNDEW